MKSSFYTVAYSIVLGTVCSALLTGVGRFTHPYKEKNERAEEVRNILGVLQVPFDPRAKADELLKVCRERTRKGSHKELRFFASVEDGKCATAALLFNGQGLWGPVEGFLALDPDLREVRGVTFHKQEETPGLGGEIASEGFRAQFAGKRIEGEDGAPGIRIKKGGGAVGPSEVDGISGATMTCQKVEAMLNAIMARIAEEREGLKAAIDNAIGEDPRDVE
ncbi:MAG: FMN-binding protein [Planctomycetota bacterium]|jgi:Na+-transporting NADH:ubiquinone oxidoreductase subunit C